MANMKLFFVLGAIFLCGVATVVRCEEEAIEMPQPSEDTVEDDIEAEQVDDEIDDEDEANDNEDEEADDEEEEDENETDDDEESADPSQRVVYTKTYTYVSKPVVYTSHKVITSHKVVSSSSSSSHHKVAAKKCVGGFTSLGCWKDTATRAIQPLDKYLGGGNYKARKDAINKCFKLATSRGLNVFGVQDGGWCAGSKSFTSYRKYGKAGNCKNGKGGGWANNVYRINRCAVTRPPVIFRSLGCWKDTATRAIQPLDKYLGGGNYKARKDAINKCFKLATSRGLNVFGVQDGGWCAGSKSFTSYRKYGKAGNCKNGKGGGWANNVYRIIRAVY